MARQPQKKNRILPGVPDGERREIIEKLRPMLAQTAKNEGENPKIREDAERILAGIDLSDQKKASQDIGVLMRVDDPGFQREFVYPYLKKLEGRDDAPKAVKEMAERGLKSLKTRYKLE